MGNTWEVRMSCRNVHEGSPGINTIKAWKLDVHLPIQITHQA